jgi:hypothetical protein
MIRSQSAFQMRAKTFIVPWRTSYHARRDVGVVTACPFDLIS